MNGGEMRGLAFAGIGFSFAAIVGVMTYLGHLADGEWGTRPWLTITGGMLGVALAMFDLIRSVQRIERLNADRKQEP